MQALLLILAQLLAAAEAVEPKLFSELLLATALRLPAVLPEAQLLAPLEPVGRPTEADALPLR